MARMKKTEFVGLMSKLRGNYQNAISDPDLWLISVTEYSKIVELYDAAPIRAAFAVAWRAHAQWMPSLGQLVELIESQGLSAADAWPEVLRLAKQSSGAHSDPVACEAIQAMGGGKRLGQMSEKDLAVWGRKQFEDLYSRMSKRSGHQAAVAIDAPAQLGDPDRVALIVGGVANAKRIEQ